MTSTSRPRLIRHWLNFSMGSGRKDVEPSLGVSLTVPDQSLSIKTILDRYTRGLPINQHMPVYSDLDLPDLKRMDLVDIAEYRDAVKQSVVDLRDLLKKQQADAVEAPKLSARAKRKATADLAQRALTLKAAAEAGIDLTTLTE